LLDKKGLPRRGGTSDLRGLGDRRAKLVREGKGEESGRSHGKTARAYSTKKYRDSLLILRRRGGGYEMKSRARRRRPASAK